MPSPFPGMNPYFEQTSHWSDFHNEFLTFLRRQLAPQLAPDYIVQLDSHVYIHDLPPEPRQLLGRPDIAVVRSDLMATGRPILGLLEAPVEVQLPTFETERVAFLEIRDRAGLELVTVIELLSPSNKRPGEDRQQYLAKRRALFRSDTHLVEIDLLRGWSPMPAEGRLVGDYSVLVSRSGKRPIAEFWPIGLRDRLPVIPIPLKEADPDGRVDLQQVLHQAYDGPGYEMFIYKGSPEPPLRGDDTGWARGFLPGAG